MKNFLYLTAILSSIALSVCHVFDNDFEGIKILKDKVCDTKNKLSEQKFGELIACGRDLHANGMHHKNATHNCKDLADDVKELKLKDNGEQNDFVIMLCSDKFKECKKQKIEEWKNKQKENNASQRNSTVGEETHKLKREEHRKKMEQKIKCMTDALAQQ